MPTSIAPSELAATVADQGFAVVRGLIPQAALQPVRDALAAEVERVMVDMHSKGLISDLARELPFERRLASAGHHVNRYGRGWTEAMTNRAVYDLHGCPELLAVLRELLGPVVIGHRQFNLRPKLPGQELTTVPWHQDSAYYGAYTIDDTIYTVWIPLVPTDEANGCMQIVPRSHREGLHEHETETTEAGFLRMRAEPDPARVLTLPMVPGDVLIMHNLLWHRSLANTSDGVRWSIDLRYYAPTTPNAKQLLWGFAEPWVLCGGSGEPIPMERWASWYPNPKKG